MTGCESMEQKMTRLRAGIREREIRDEERRQGIRRRIEAADPALLAFLDDMREAFDAKLMDLSIHGESVQ